MLIILGISYLGIMCLILNLIFSDISQLKEDIKYYLFYIIGFVVIVVELFITSYDTVYCDETGIKIVRRKKTIECTWGEVYRLERISGNYGGHIGLMLTTTSGEKIDLFPPLRVEPKFIEYVNKTAPFIKIGVYDFTYSGK